MLKELEKEKTFEIRKKSESAAKKKIKIEEPEEDKFEAFSPTRKYNA